MSIWTGAQYEQQPKGVGTPKLTSNHFGKEEASMELDKDTIFVLTREDVIECAREMGIPEDAITDDVLRMVRKGVDNGLECWSMVVKEALNFALKS
jgi:hypothetical protein